MNGDMEFLGCSGDQQNTHGFPEPRHRPWSALPLWARRPSKANDQCFSPGIPSSKICFNSYHVGPAKNFQSPLPSDAVSMDWFDLDWDSCLDTTTTASPVLDGFFNSATSPSGGWKTLNDAEKIIDNLRDASGSECHSDPQRSGSHGNSNNENGQDKPSSIEEIGIAVSVLDDEPDSLSGKKCVWRCSYPACSSRMLFLRVCDLRKHYRRHSQRLYCRHPGCPRSVEGVWRTACSTRRSSTSSSSEEAVEQMISLSDSSSIRQVSTCFASERDRARHEAKHNPRIRCSWEGGICGRVFSRLDNMKDHVQRVHQGAMHGSEYQGKRRRRRRNTFAHVSRK